MASGRLDRELESHLVRGETVVIAVRQHWFSLLRPIAIVVGLLFFATFVEAEAPRTRGGANLANFFWLLAILGGGGHLLWRYLNWRHDWFVATDKRFLLFYGFIRRKVAMMPLMKVTDMTFDRTLLGRIIGYGTFLLESAGQEQALSRIEYVPDANEHYQAICTVLFGSDDAALDPDDNWLDDDGQGGDDGDYPDDDPDDDLGDGPRGGGDRGSWADVRAGRTFLGQASSRLTGRPGGSTGPGVRNPVREAGSPRPPHETLYQSSDLVRAARLDDTGEIPVIRPRGDRRRQRREF